MLARSGRVHGGAVQGQFIGCPKLVLLLLQLRPLEERLLLHHLLNERHLVLGLLHLSEHRTCPLVLLLGACAGLRRRTLRVDLGRCRARTRIARETARCQLQQFQLQVCACRERLLERRLALGPVARQPLVARELVHDDAEREDVRSESGLHHRVVENEQLRREVAAVTILPAPLRICDSETEVAHFGNAVIVHEDVVRFDVQMHDVVGMQKVQPGRNLPHDPPRRQQRQLHWREPLDDALDAAVDNVLHLHPEVLPLLPATEVRHHVGMQRQVGHRIEFVAIALPVRPVPEFTDGALDRVELAVEAVPRAVHLTEGSLAYELVRVELVLVLEHGLRPRERFGARCHQELRFRERVLACERRELARARLRCEKVHRV
mmetsp:Transcript_12623/g.53088  ORF Transcript_12623/g.53088 Transcript_12623/m.53088 type:complete len:377 (+) Transcript_12623:266-1396(+)